MPKQDRADYSDDEIQAAWVEKAPQLNSTVTLAEYDPDWPELYQREAERIRTILGDRIVQLEHVGSTSVPGLCAKPIIDIMLIVADSSEESAYVPDLENAESYVAALARRGVIARDDVVEAAIRGGGQPLTIRSIQRHFRATTGMTHGLFRRIERARHATLLLRDGASILDTVHEAGYFDQAHLTRSLGVLIGETPASIMRHDAQLSFLYKTG